MLATYTFGDALLTMLGVFLLVAWLWVIFAIIADLFRDRELSGWAKAAWIFFLIFVPVLTALVYIVVRGHGMHRRAVEAQVETQRQFDRSVREAAGAAPPSPVDELRKLADLRNAGAISPEEYDRLKSKVVSA